MFIVSPTKGGYRGDVVNSGFRQGRQDAYRDYIDNFNFALKADAANNAENQKQVERIANNYALQNQMRQGARNEALNFVNDSAKIDDALTSADISFVKNAELRNPETVRQLGESQATQVRATQNANENNAAYKANTAQTMVEQQPIEANARKAKLEASTVASEFSKQKGSLGLDSTNWLSTYGGEKGYEPYIDSLVDSRANELVAEAQQRGEVLDPNEVKQQLASDPQFIRDGYAEYQKVLSQAQNQHNLSDGYYTDQNGNPVNARYGSRGRTATGGEATSSTGKPQQKAYKMGESFQSFKETTPHEYVSENAIRSGNTIYFANGQMITFPEGTNMEEKVKEYANYDMIRNVEQPKQK